MVIVRNCIHINSFLKKRTYAEHIADAQEEEEHEKLAKRLAQIERKNVHGRCVFSVRRYIRKGRRN